MAVINPRVRFAPSPTGNLHIGGMRTALFNYLFAKRYNGTFIVRIEDTDKVRSKKEYVTAQCDALKWAGITSDQPLVYQSERTHRYQTVINQLIDQKKVYRCYCSDAQKAERAKTAGVAEEFFGYDGFCKNADQEQDKPFVLRFAVPESVKTIQFTDLIRGEVTFDKNQIDDFIIARSDGSPTYNFVVVVDDADMKISHVIRGEDHLSNTPKQILLYQACGFDTKEFAHIPLIINSQGKRLSKRDGAVDVLTYKHNGYLPQALVNYCVRLGWAHKDQEIFSKNELIHLFDLKNVGKKSAVFDNDKLDWVNTVYMKNLSDKDCLEWIIDTFDSEFLKTVSRWNNQQIITAIGLFKPRVTTGKELTNVLVGFCNFTCKDYDTDAVLQWITPETITYLADLNKAFDEVLTWNAQTIKEVIKHYCKQHNIKLPAVAQPLRIALIGSTESPGVFDILALLGKSESLKRINALKDYHKNS